MTRHIVTTRQLTDRRAIVAVIATTLLLARPDSAAAQSAATRFEIGAHVASTSSSQFDETDAGLGARISWHPAGWIGADAELSGYPGNFPGQRPFSRGRVEGLFGATVGRTIGNVRPFGKLRPGFLTFRESSEPFACILIFPPPLACTLASGQTLFALDIGGGVEVYATPKTFVRVDVGDLLLRYPGPVFDAADRAVQDSFFSHNFRFAAGAGWRF
jgi:hypothetical protein